MFSPNNKHLVMLAVLADQGNQVQLGYRLRDNGRQLSKTFHRTDAMDHGDAMRFAADLDADDHVIVAVWTRVPSEFGTTAERQS